MSRPRLPYCENKWIYLNKHRPTEVLSKAKFTGVCYNKCMSLREKKHGRHTNTDLIFSPDHGGEHLSRQLDLAFKNRKMKRNATMKSDPAISERAEKIGCFYSNLVSPSSA